MNAANGPIDEVAEAIGCCPTVSAGRSCPYTSDASLHDLDPAGFPHHVAIICDGNRRWAREAGFEDVSHGHRVGAQRIAEMLGWCADLGIGTVTIYLLSIENLSRESRGTRRADGDRARHRRRDRPTDRKLAGPDRRHP